MARQSQLPVSDVLGASINQELLTLIWRDPKFNPVLRPLLILLVRLDVRWIGMENERGRGMGQRDPCDRRRGEGVEVQCARRTLGQHGPDQAVASAEAESGLTEPNELPGRREEPGYSRRAGRMTS